MTLVNRCNLVCHRLRIRNNLVLLSFRCRDLLWSETEFLSKLVYSSLRIFCTLRDLFHHICHCCLDIISRLHCAGFKVSHSYLSVRYCSSELVKCTFCFARKRCSVFLRLFSTVLFSIS